MQALIPSDTERWVIVIFTEIKSCTLISFIKKDITSYFRFWLWPTVSFFGRWSSLRENWINQLVATTEVTLREHGAIETWMLYNAPHIHALRWLHAFSFVGCQVKRMHRWASPFRFYRRFILSSIIIQFICHIKGDRKKWWINWTLN